jgi:hypothetical protein
VVSDVLWQRLGSHLAGKVSDAGANNSVCKIGVLHFVFWLRHSLGVLGWDLHLIYLNVLHLEFFITVLALGLLKTETNTSVKSRMAKNTDKAPTHLQVEANTSVNSGMATGTDKAPSPLLMAV